MSCHPCLVNLQVIVDCPCEAASTNESVGELAGRIGNDQNSANKQIRNHRNRSGAPGVWRESMLAFDSFMGVQRDYRQ